MNFRLIVAAGGSGFLDRLLDRFTDFAGALLNSAKHFFMLPFGELQIVIRELGSFLFQLAFGDVPVAFNFECSHNGTVYFWFWFSFAANVAARVFAQSRR